MEEFRKVETWHGEHKGVRYEVAHWHLGWNYYIILPVEQIPEEKRKVFILDSKKSKYNPERIENNYDSIPDLDWHGGITFYEKFFGQVVCKNLIEVNVTSIKMGCDYMHLFDENKTYTFNLVKSDVIHSIDKLLDFVPDMKIRCQWNGHYYPRDEGQIDSNGYFLANENKNKMEESIFKLSKIYC